MIALMAVTNAINCLYDLYFVVNIITFAVDERNDFVSKRNSCIIIIIIII